MNKVKKVDSWKLIEVGDKHYPVEEEVKLELLDCLRDLPGRRSVWRAKAQEGHQDILVKIYLKHRKQERDSTSEWKNAQDLCLAGLPIPAPLFIAECGDQRAVAFEFISHGEVITPDLLGSDEGGVVLNQLAQIHEQAHKHGYFQDDNHMGNYLWDGSKLRVIDAGTYQSKGSELCDEDRIENLAIMGASLPLNYGKQYLQALNAHYQHSSSGVDGAIEQAITNRRSSYFRKTQRSCTEFERLREQGKDLLSCRDMDQQLRKSLLKDPDAMIDGGKWLKKGNTCSVVELKHDGKTYILKRYNKKSLFYRFLHFANTPRALASWSNGHTLRLFGVVTPRPVACLLTKSTGLLVNAYLLMEVAEGISLGRVSKQGLADLVPKAAEGFSQRWYELGMLRATHGDMKASNFILGDAGELHLIDLDSLQFHTSPKGFEKRKKKDLRRFIKNWSKFPALGEVFKTAIGDS